MYTTNNYARINNNNIAKALIHEPSIHFHIHWLNPLLFKHIKLKVA